jgi:hypothetical protein
LSINMCEGLTLTFCPRFLLHPSYVGWTITSQHGWTDLCRESRWVCLSGLGLHQRVANTHCVSENTGVHFVLFSSLPSWTCTDTVSVFYMGRHRGLTPSYEPPIRVLLFVYGRGCMLIFLVSETKALASAIRVSFQ